MKETHSLWLIFFACACREGKNARLSSFLLQLTFCVWKFCGRCECPADFKVLANLRSLSLSLILLFFYYFFFWFGYWKDTTHIATSTNQSSIFKMKRFVVGVATIALETSLNEAIDFFCLEMSGPVRKQKHYNYFHSFAFDYFFPNWFGLWFLYERDISIEFNFKEEKNIHHRSLPVLVRHHSVRHILATKMGKWKR